MNTVCSTRNVVLSKVVDDFWICSVCCRCRTVWIKLPLPTAWEIPYKQKFERFTERETFFRRGEAWVINLHFMMNLFYQTTESECVIPCEVNDVVQKDPTAESTIEDSFAYLSARLWKWNLFCPRRWCVSHLTMVVFVIFFDELFPSLHHIVKKAIIWNSSVDRNATNAKRSRFTYALEVKHRHINSGELNIRPVKITFTGCWSVECQDYRSFATADECWYSI
jgi:hypothetical protein